MARSKPKKLPQFESLDKLVEFFDTHDMGDYWEQMPEAQFEIDIQHRTHLFSLDDELAERLMEIAKAKHVPSEALINSWLREKVLEEAK